MMLPSRGIVRSLPPSGVLGHTLSATPRTALRSGRQYGTLKTGRMALSGGLSTGSTLRAQRAAAPLVLGTVASSRNLSWPSFSIWGYGKKKDEAATTSSAPPAAEPPSMDIPSEQALEASSAQSAATPAPADVVTSSSAEAASQDPELAAISDLVNGSGSEILNRAEEIGYLASLGLDYGWGPTSVMQWVLEHIHVWGGLGWAGAIVASAFALRVAMFYPTVKSTKFSAGMKRMQEDPRFPETSEMLKLAIRDGDRQAQAQAQALNGILRKEYDVPMRRMLWSFIPIPFSYGLFRIVTGMTNIPVPSLENAGWLWFTDLTQSDPYMILPVMATGLMVAAIDINAANTPTSQQGTLKTMKYILVPIMLFGTSFLSAAVNLMGLSFGLATLINTIILNTNSIRRALGIPPLERRPATASQPAIHPAPGQQAPGSQQPIYEAPRPQQAVSMRDKLARQIDAAKKMASEKMGGVTGNATTSMEEKAERRRKEQIRKAEEKRRQQERDHFQSKYKSKR